jgi:hypothetical protein
MSIVTEPNAVDTTTPALRSKPLARRVLHWVRRLHLFLGLLLLPWALLYGVSGFLFNHPTAFPDRPTATFGRDDLRGTPLEGLPGPAELASEVVAALNGKGGSYRLVYPDEAAYSRSRVTVQAFGRGVEHSVVLDLAGGMGFVRSNRSLDHQPAPFSAKSGVRTATSLPDCLANGTPVVLRNMGLDADEAIPPGTLPDLTFFMEVDERVWKVTYQLGRGGVSGRPADAPGQRLSTRRFLTQLHLAREYPAGGGVRWLWAVAVDAMAFVMVFWAASGLFMWWQIKAVRGWGAVVLVFSAAAAALMGLGMYRALSP